MKGSELQIVFVQLEAHEHSGWSLGRIFESPWLLQVGLDLVWR
jgi:hypothetical protein